MTDITNAMVLAAGRGTRMRHLAATRPKPLVVLAGRPLIDGVLDHFRAAGVTRIVVNTHHKGAMIAAHLAGQPDIALSPEAKLLETGGGVANALALLGSAPFFVVNCDAVWLDGPRPALRRLREIWDGAAMDALLLMQRMTAQSGDAGRGDYFLDPLGRASRRTGHCVAPYLFAGVQILHPRLFEGAPGGAFSLNRLYDRAQAAGRLWGIVHDGAWYHVGTPEQRQQAEADIALPVFAAAKR
jgi:MurNAc alpha-1-phosphate uridylyltransferase